MFSRCLCLRSTVYPALSRLGRWPQADKVHVLRGHTRAVCGLAYHPKDVAMLSASFDGTVRLWSKV